MDDAGRVRGSQRPADLDRNLAGALVGGIILGITESIGALFLPTAFRDAYGLVFLVAILLFRPSGLFGSQK